MDRGSERKGAVVIYDYNYFDRIKDISLTYERGFKSGRAIEHREMGRKLAVILAAYDHVKDDPQARIPTMLTLAIEASRK